MIRSHEAFLQLEKQSNPKKKKKKAVEWLFTGEKFGVRKAVDWTRVWFSILNCSKFTTDNTSE